MGFRRTRCPHCKGKLEAGQRIHPECIDAYAEAEGAKAERKRLKQERMAARVEKAEIRRRKDAAKPRAKWLSECQDIINKIVRLRDKHLGCCSCDRGPGWDGQWHASHLRSVGAASAVRFHLWNIHKGCSICNKHLSGNLAEYLPRIRARIGDEKVDWLYTQNQLVKHDVEYLKKFKRVMGRRLRRIEKRNN
ncbi:recombination protein NinG [Delftia sp. NA_296.1]|uniref:recombination protein NinG n=1 Tax=Delftia sp. NA_296.1 TaxID=3415648 RepID=UPI0040461629